jgi:hypothetical protein
LSVEEVVARMIAGHWPMMIEHGMPMVDPTASVQWIEVKSDDGSDDASMNVPVLPESALPRAADRTIDVDAIHAAEVIEFDYHAARAATAKRRKPPTH